MNSCFLILVTLNIFSCFSTEQITENKDSKVFYTKSDGLIKILDLNKIIKKNPLLKTPNDCEFDIEEKPADEFVANSLDQSIRVCNSDLDVIKKIPLFNSEIIIQQSEYSIENRQSINLKTDSQQNTQKFISSLIDNNKKSKKSTYDKFIDCINQSCCNNKAQVTNLEEILYQQ